MKMGRLCLILFALTLCSLSGLMVVTRQKSPTAGRVVVAASSRGYHYTEWGVVYKGGMYTFNMPKNHELVRHALRGNDIHPTAWSPDGQYVVYHVLKHPDCTIFIAQADGSKPYELTTDQYFNIHPNWSPDGHWIAYISIRDLRPQLYKIRPDGTDEQLLATDVDANTLPTWSPDGRWIAFVRMIDGNADIYRLRQDASSLERLTHGREFDGFPAWSPDGRWIAYLSRRQGAWSLYRMTPNGDDHQPLSTDYAVAQRLITWSPDGKWIAFESQAGDIFRIGYDGDSLQQLTSHSGRAMYPRWSPDGEWIAFLAINERGISTLHIMRPDGSQLQKLSNEPASFAPLWSPQNHQSIGMSWKIALAAIPFMLGVGYRRWFSTHREDATSAH